MTAYLLQDARNVPIDGGIWPTMEAKGDGGTRGSDAAELVLDLYYRNKSVSVGIDR